MQSLTRRAFLSVGAAYAAAPIYPSWKMIGPWGGSARAIRLDARDPASMLAITMRGAGVFRSRDGGAVWSECLNFPQLEGARLDAAWIANTPQSLWLVGAAPGGLWMSLDAGESWKQSPGTEKLSIYAISAWPKDSRVLALGTNQGVWLSHDAAQSWRRVSPASIPDLAAIVSVAFDPRLAGTIYAGTPHLPWKSTDGGKTWRKAHLGMYDDSDIFSIAVDPSLPSRVFASACSGIYCSLNAGAAWRRAQGIPGSNRRTYVVAQSPHDGKRVFAGTSAGMWTSSDQGATWKKLNDYVATSIAFHPMDKDLFYISTERHGLLWTQDAGLTFRRRDEGFVSRSLQRVESAQNGFRIADEFDRAIESLPAPPQAYDSRRDPFNKLHLLAATPRGLQRSRDGGTSWHAVDGGLGQDWIRSVTFHPKQSGTAFALRGQRVFWTRDHGERWYWLPAQENVRSRFRRLDIPETDAHRLFATSEDRGLYVYALDENPLE